MKDFLKYLGFDLLVTVGICLLSLFTVPKCTDSATLLFIKSVVFCSVPANLILQSAAYFKTEDTKLRFGAKILIYCVFISIVMLLPLLNMLSGLNDSRNLAICFSIITLLIMNSIILNISNLILKIFDRKGMNKLHAIALSLSLVAMTAILLMSF